MLFFCFTEHSDEVLLFIRAIIIIHLLTLKCIADVSLPYIHNIQKCYQTSLQFSFRKCHVKVDRFQPLLFCVLNLGRVLLKAKPSLASAKPKGIFSLKGCVRTTNCQSELILDHPMDITSII